MRIGRHLDYADVSVVVPGKRSLTALPAAPGCPAAGHWLGLGIFLPHKRDMRPGTAPLQLAGVTKCGCRACELSSATENTVAQNAMATQALAVLAGTTVTFKNPAGNSFSHGAASFFDSGFDTGTLAPGQSFTHTLAAPGQYYCSDPVFPQGTGLVIVR
jgi:hypothetical protein